MILYVEKKSDIYYATVNGHTFEFLQGAIYETITHSPSGIAYAKPKYVKIKQGLKGYEVVEKTTHSCYYNIEFEKMVDSLKLDFTTENILMVVNKYMRTNYTTLQTMRKAS